MKEDDDRGMRIEVGEEDACEGGGNCVLQLLYTLVVPSIFLAVDTREPGDTHFRLDASFRTSVATTS